MAVSLCHIPFNAYISVSVTEALNYSLYFTLEIFFYILHLKSFIQNQFSTLNMQAQGTACLFPSISSKLLSLLCTVCITHTAELNQPLPTFESLHSLNFFSTQNLPQYVDTIVSFFISLTSNIFQVQVELTSVLCCTTVHRKFYLLPLLRLLAPPKLKIGKYFIVLCFLHIKEFISCLGGG